MTRFPSFFRNLFGTSTPPARKQPAGRRLGLESLEAREVPAIFLLNGVLNVVGGNYNDAVTISAEVGPGDDVVTQMVATRTETIQTSFGTLLFQESKTFDWGAVQSVRVELGNGTNSYTGLHTRQAVVIGGTGNDRMIGGSGTDFFFGYGGSDGLHGNGGNDYLYGGTGADVLSGGAGNDVLDGDTGNDQLYGDDGNDSVWGGDGNDHIRGGNGNDVLRGEDGNDFITADEGNDSLYGGNGDDQLWGGWGADVLDGGPGYDSVWQDYPPVSP